MIQRQKSCTTFVAAVALLTAGVPAPGARAEPATSTSAEASATSPATPDATASLPGTEAVRAPAAAETTSPETERAGADVYAPPPPERRLPGGRMGGSTRGPAACPSDLLALVPESHVGLTASPEPTLYWYLGEATTCRIDFVLNDPRATTPIVERRLTGPHGAGIHALALADFGASLDPGVVYTWFVTLVPDPDARSKDVLSGGQIARVEAPDEGTAAPVALDDARSLGQRGLWYDALAALQQGLVSGAAGQDDQRTAASLLLQRQGLGIAVTHGGSGVDVAAPPPSEPRSARRAAHPDAR